MAIDQGTEVIALTSQERTWRINIETPKGGEPVVTVWRETVKTASDGSIISREGVGRPVERSLSAIAGQTYNVGGKTYTTAEIAGAIAVIADAWRQEDIAAAQLAAEQAAAAQLAAEEAAAAAAQQQSDQQQNEGE
jgi:hypothetical protein